MEKLLALLNDLNIPFLRYDHPALHTVEEAREYDAKMEGTHCKNLFLKDKKGQYFLFSTEAEKQIDTKILRKKIGCNHLSFASAERLDEVLKLKPGSVCPFGIINDEEKKVKVILDKDIMGKEKVNFHPLKNTATVTISSDDLLKFINHVGNEYMEVEL